MIDLFKQCRVCGPARKIQAKLREAISNANAEAGYEVLDVPGCDYSIGCPACDNDGNELSDQAKKFASLLTADLAARIGRLERMAIEKDEELAVKHGLKFEVPF